jgi:tripartite-type tricarboxylate transporter receptor subunit TctC
VRADHRRARGEATVDRLGNEPVGNTPEQFAADIKAEAPRWKEIADKAAIRLE